MKLFKRKTTESRAMSLIEKFFEDSGRAFAEHQMREQADNHYRIKKLEREENIKERFAYLSSLDILTDEQECEFKYSEWYCNIYLKIKNNKL